MAQSGDRMYPTIVILDTCTAHPASTCRSKCSDLNALARAEIAELHVNRHHLLKKCLQLLHVSEIGL